MTVSQLIVAKKKQKKSICQHHTDIYLFFVLAIMFVQLMDSKNTFYSFSPFIGNSYGWVCLFSIKAKHFAVLSFRVESVQDFLIKLDMKPCMHLVEISIFSLNHVIVRLTKIMNNLLEHLKIRTFKVIFLC